MEVIITKHAVERFRERIENLPKKQLRHRLEEMLAHTIDLTGRKLRSMIRDPNKDYWVHEQTGAIFVVEIDEGLQQIVVLTVLFDRKAERPVAKSAKKRHAPHHTWMFGRKHGRAYRRRKGGFVNE